MEGVNVDTMIQPHLSHLSPSLLTPSLVQICPNGKYLKDPTVQGSVMDRKAKEKLGAVGSVDLDLNGKDLMSVVGEVGLADKNNGVARVQSGMNCSSGLPDVVAVEADVTESNDSSDGGHVER